MSWRLWTGNRTPSDEIYLAPRHMAGDWKISIHSSGHRQSGPTKRLRDRLSPDDRWAESVWSQADERWLAAILIHRVFLRPGPLRSDELAIEVLDHEEAWLVIVTDEPLSDATLRHVGSISRRSEPPVHVTLCPIPPTPDVINEITELVQNPGTSWSMPVDWADNPFGFGELDIGANTPLLFEMANDADSGTHDQKWFKEFPGDVRPIEDCPVEAPPDVDPCAIVHLRSDHSATLYFAPHARCNHTSLVAYATAAMNRFWTAGPDGWEPVDPSQPGAGYITLIATRSAIERSGRAMPNYGDLGNAQ